MTYSLLSCLMECSITLLIYDVKLFCLKPQAISIRPFTFNECKSYEIFYPVMNVTRLVYIYSYMYKKNISIHGFSCTTVFYSMCFWCPAVVKYIRLILSSSYVYLHMPCKRDHWIIVRFTTWSFISHQIYYGNLGIDKSNLTSAHHFVLCYYTEHCRLRFNVERT